MATSTAVPRTRRRAVAALCALALPVAGAGPALAHDGSAHVTTASLTEPLQAPVTSDNVRLVASLPETTAISMEFARTGSFAYVSSLDTISVLDLQDPRNPVVRGTLVNALFENEAMTYGEKMVQGELVRFVIAAIDLYQASPDDPTHVNVDSGPEVAIVDVTDPDNPFIRSRTPLEGDGAVTTSTHTVQCVDQADCRYAYSAGNGSAFSIVDLTDLDAPRQLTTVPSPAAAPGDSSEGQGFSRGAGHYWDFDGALGWHTGSGGAAAFDVSDPAHPVVVNGTDEQGRGAPINDFILHNSMRPNAAAFAAGAAPSISNGNVLLVTEEDYFDDGDELVCSQAGSFQTWYVPDLDAQAYRAKNPDGATPDLGTITPLDSVTAADLGGGATLPATGFCSAHWFDVHQDGFVAQGFYGAGLRILDVRDARQITQHGYATGVATQVWDAYWVPERNRAGKAIPGKKTDLVYTADAVRGIEVYEVDLDGASSGTLDVVATTTTDDTSGATITSALLPDPGTYGGGAGGADGVGGGAAAVGAGLAGLAAALLAAATARRRRPA